MYVRGVPYLHTAIVEAENVTGAVEAQLSSDWRVSGRPSPLFNRDQIANVIARNSYILSNIKPERDGDETVLDTGYVVISWAPDGVGVNVCVQADLEQEPEVETIAPDLDGYYRLDPIGELCGWVVWSERP